MAHVLLNDAPMPRGAASDDDCERLIERYLEEHPDAADTAEGISQWWLSEPGPTLSVSDVQRALDALVARGVVGRIDRPGMPSIYRRA